MYTEEEGLQSLLVINCKSISAYCGKDDNNVEKNRCQFV